MTETLTKESTCPAVSDKGVACVKPLYLSRSGEYWDHAGGHLFASKQTIEVLNTYHYDAGVLLSGQSADVHKPEDCTFTGFCEWRKYDN